VSERNLQRKITKTRQQLQQKELAKLKIFIVWAPQRGSTNLHHRPDQPASIPFGHSQEPKTTRTDEPHTLTKRRVIGRPNGTSNPQEQDATKKKERHRPATLLTAKW
jgi:hypothetical protein